jgi:YD repeat-containing protein
MFRSAKHWVWLLLCWFALAGQVWAKTCDVDKDADVDLDDVTLLQRMLPARPTVTGPDDPRDPDHNGRIDIGDVRACILLCTRAKCSTINQAPFANAGPDQTVKVGDPVHLSGAASSDPDGDPLRYTWTFNRPLGSLASLIDGLTVAPRFTADKPGQYLIQLIVSDGKLDSAPDTVIVSTENSRPIANAGPDQSVRVGTLVMLNGGRSTDVDGDPLTYTWQLASVPPGSGATLGNPDTVNPTLLIDQPGSYLIALTVSDGKVPSLPDTVTVTTENSPPVANAGANQSIPLGATITLDGSHSSDVDGNPLTFRWSLLARPPGSTAVLSNPNSVSPSFNADAPGTYVAQLIVNDGSVDSAPASVTLTTANAAPIANAGPDQSVPLGSSATLDGSASHDPEGAALTYTWSLTGRPAGSNASLSGGNTVNPSFTLDRPGNYVAQLIVGDGQLASAPDTVTLSTTNSRPVAVAGAAQTVTAGTPVQLDGSASHDADGDPITFIWSLTSLPLGSKAAVTPADGVSPSFVPDLAGSYIAQLIVSDGQLSSVPATVVITVSAANRKPIAVAEAVPTQTTVGSPVVLKGSASSDPDGDPLTWSWSIALRPGGSNASIVSPTAAQTSFVPDVPGIYTIQLVVRDGKVDSVPALVVVEALAANHPPVITSTPATTATVGQPYSYAAQAIDPDLGDVLTWSLLTAPSGMTIDPASGLIAWTPGVGQLGNQKVSVRVTDQGGLPATQDFEIAVGAPNHAPVITFAGFAPQWTQLSPTGVIAAPRHVSGTNTYDDINDRLITFGGDNNTASPLNDTWVLVNPTALTGAASWLKLEPVGTIPAGRHSHSAIYDPTANRLIIYGGCVGHCTQLADAWALTHANGLGGAPEWIALPSGMPSMGHAVGYDPVSNRMIVFGGLPAGPGSDTNAVRVLVDANGIGTPQWITLTPDGTPPSPRGQWAEAAYDPIANRLLVYGGRTSRGVEFNDLWILHNANGLGGTPRWEQLSPNGRGPSLRNGYSSVHDLNSNRLIVHSGVDYTPNPNLYFNETWILNNANGVGGTPEWIRQTTVGVAPVPRAHFVAGYARSSNRMVLAFGRSQDTAGLVTVYDDAWVLSNASGNCTAGQACTFQATAADPDVGDALTFALDAAPPGMTIGAASGAIVWTPAITQIGNHAVTVRVEDRGGLFATQTFTATVASVAVPNVVGLAPEWAESFITAADLAVGTTTSQGGAITLNFDSLPSRQGWTYQTESSVPESRAFSVDGTSLRLDTTGLGVNQTAFYDMFGAVERRWPFKANVRAQVLSEELALPNNALGMNFTVRGRQVGLFSVGLGAARIQLQGLEVISFDTAASHDYLLEGQPAQGYRLAVDGVLLRTGAAALDSDPPSRLRLGDVTFGPNSRAEISAYSYTQPRVVGQNPPPGTLVPNKTPVDLTIVDGPATETVPNVIGLSQAAAEGAIVTANLKLGGITSAPHPTVPAGQVSDQSPLPNIHVPKDTPVNVVLSTGPPAPTNRAPTITSTAPTIATAGAAYTYPVTATDPDAGDVLTWSLTTAPTGMTIDSATGLIAWTPAVGQVGANNVTVRVQDQGGLFATEGFTVSVAVPVNQPPIAVDDTYAVDEGSSLVVAGGAPAAVPLPTVTGHRVQVYAAMERPIGLAFDAAGTLYVGADEISAFPNDPRDPGFVRRVSPGGGTVQPFGPLQDDPDALVVDTTGTISGASGALLVSGTTEIVHDSHLTAILPDGTTRRILGPQDFQANASAILFDSRGRLLMSDFLQGSYRVLVIAQGTATPLVDLGSVAPWDIAIDANDRIFVAGEDGIIRVFEADGSLVNASFASGQPPMRALTFDPGGAFAGYLYAIDGGGRLLRIDTLGNTTEVGSGFDTVSASDMVFGPDRALYVSELGRGQVLRITAVQTPATAGGVLANDSDPDGDGLNAILVTQPASGILSFAPNGAFVYTPKAGFEGTDSFTYKANDGQLDSNVAVVTITVQPVNHPPVFISAPILSAIAGQPYSYDANATDPDAGDALTFSLPVSPAGMTIDPATGLITWTPDAGQVGSHPVAVRVTDAGGLFDTRVFSVVVSPAMPSCVAPPADMVAWWPLDGDATDVVGGNNGVVEGSGGIFVSGMVGHGFFSGGEDSLIAVPDSPGLSPPQLTLDAWVRLDRILENNNNMVFLWKGNSLGHNISTPYGLLICGNACAASGGSITAAGVRSGTAGVGKLGVLLTRADRSDHLIFSNATLPLGAFVHVAVTVDGSMVRIFLNGELDTEVAQIGTPFSGGLALQIGGIRNPVGGSSSFPGVIDELEIFNRALTPQEIAALFAAGSAGKCKAPAPSNRTPLITSAPVTVAIVGQLYANNVEATDPDAGDVLAFSLTTAPAGMTINAATGLITWTPTLAQVGSHSVTVRVTDQGGLIADQPYTITVSAPAPTNSPPTITSMAPTTATAGTPYTYTATATDPDAGDVLAYSLPTAPTGMSINPTTGLITWTPTLAQIGDHGVTIRVTDSGGLTAEQGLSIAVSPPAPVNQPPSFTSTPVTSATAGIPYTYPVTATDPDPGDTLTYSLTTAPPGMTINVASGVIQWTPTAAQAGDHPVEVKVQDAGGLSTTQPFTLTVSAVAACTPPPTGLVSWWPGDGNTLDRAAANDGLAENGASYAAGLVGQAFRFDGVDDLIRIASSRTTGFGGAFSVEFWFNPTTTINVSTPNQMLLAKGRYLEGGFNAPVAIQVLGGDGRLLVRMPPAPALVSSTDTWPAGTWQHIALSWDGARYRLYVNGSEEAGLDNAFSIIDSTDPITLGNADGFAAGGFAGLLDEPTLYNRALTPAEVTALHAARGLGKCTATYSRADAGPDQAVEVAATVSLDGSASRAFDGAALAYQWTLTSRPANSAAVLANPATVSPSFTADKAGAYTLDLIVSNAGRASAPDSVSITAAKVNHPPTITSTAITAGAVGTAYTYPVTASDPDPGDTLTFSLTTAPAGMSINAASGLIQWTPNAGQIGSHPVTVRVQDQGGLFVPQSFLLIVVAAPVPVSVPDVVGQEQAAAQSAISAASLSVGTVTIAASDTVAASRVISQNPAAGSVVNSGSAVALVVSSGPQGPAVTAIRVTPTTPLLLTGQSQAFAATGILANGSSLPLTGGLTWASSNPAVASIDANGLATALSQGSTTISASQGGITGSATFTVAQSVPDATLPIAEITAPADGASVASAVPIVGTASDANFLKYLIEIAPFETGVFSTLHVGTAPVTGGTLATLDPTTLVNDLYVVRLTVIDKADNRTQTEITVQITRDKKVGNFTLAFQDLNVPMAGIPIGVVRSYDSRDKTKGDFGIGWRLDVQSLRLRVVGIHGQGWQHTQSGGILNRRYTLSQQRSYRVAITLPDGKVEEFKMEVVPSTQQLVPIQVVDAVYTPTAQTRGSLRALGETRLVTFGQTGGLDLLTESGLEVFDPREYEYTTPEGQVILISRTAGVKQIRDRSGNTVSFAPGGIIHSAGKSITFARDGQGRITTVTDPMGNAQTYAYDINGDLASHTDAEGRRTSFLYNYDHGLIEIQDPRGIRPIRNEYDAAGRLIKTIDAYGKEITYTHDLGANRELITDRLGNTTIHVYDDLGNVTQTADPLGGVTNRSYDARGNTLSETDPLGRTRSNSYDGQDNRLTETDPLGATTTYTYNNSRQVLTVTDALGRITSNAYDANGNLTSSTDPAGQVTTYTYDARGLQTTRTDPLGQITSYAYDASGNLASETDALGRVSTYSYDANGNRLTQSTTRSTAGGPETLTTRFTYDKANRLTETTHPDGSVTRVTYNAIGKQSITTDALGRETKFDYDDMGRLTRTTYPDGSSETSAYDAEGRRTGSTDRAGRTTTSTYDPLGRLVETIAPDGSRTGTTYDAAGQVLASTDARGNVTGYEYDAAGRRSKVTDAAGATTLFTYDALGNQIQVTDANGHSVGFQYDANNRRTRTNYADGTFDQVSYDTLGRQTAKTDQAGLTTQFAYDALGRLTSVTDALGQITRYSYDELGNQLTQIDAEGRTTSFAYDKMGRRIKRTLPLGQTETFSYDAAGNLRTKTDFNGRTTSYTYDTVNRLTRKTPDGSLGQPPVVFSYTPSGQRASMQDASGSTTYSYDNRDRLLSKVTPQGTLSYSYDAAGNLTRIQSNHAGGAAMDYSYDARNRLASVTDAEGRVTTYSYDAVGNLAGFLYPNGVQTTYTYNTVNRLTNVTGARGGATIAGYTYTLGPSGNRTAVTEASGRSVDYTYDDLYRLRSETISADPAGPNGAIAYTYDRVGNRLTRTSTVAGIPDQSFNYDFNDRLDGEGYDNNGNTLTSGGRTFGYDFENHLTSADGGVSFVYNGDGIRVAKTAGGVTTGFLVDDR